MSSTVQQNIPASDIPTGTLYGIGVGPGAPDLLTLRAVSVLGMADVILAAASPKNDDSLALSIAKPHLPAAVDIVRLNFPMTRDRAVLEKAWKENADTTAALLRSGKNAAFLTLGDPLIYSTFGYLMRTLHENHPGFAVEVVPGITSFQMAAAATATVLCEGGESLTVAPGINTGEELRNTLDRADSAVIMKTYRNAEVIYKTLADDSRCDEAVFASRLGLEGEITEKGLDRMPASPHYLSLLLVPPKR